LNTYWVIVEINFRQPLASTSPELEESLGCFQTFGCTSNTEEEMKQSILSVLAGEEWLEAHGATFEFDVSVIEQPDIQREVLLDQEIRDFIVSSPYEPGVWYQSGRAFFHDGEEEHGHLVELVPNDTH
jgi:hypothetical protein